MEQIKRKVAGLPHSPGCYLMKDGVGRVCYVGKAKDLRLRVAHYFTGASRHDPKTKALVAVISDFDIIMTNTEVEALLLERTLIKHHKPRFNVLLRDDREYPFVRVDFNETWPRLEKTRRRRADDALYLGPYGNAGQLHVLLEAAKRIFPLIRCSRHEFQTAKRPCNYYHIRLCAGPCTLPVDRGTYVQMVRDAVDFLRGRNQAVTRSIQERMAAAAAAENYELAAQLRDQLRAIEGVSEAQAVVAGDIADADAFGMAVDERRAVFQALTVREGKLVASDNFAVAAPAMDAADAMREFLLQYYDGRSLPAEILLAMDLPDGEAVRLALRESHPEALTLELRRPQRGSRADLVEMADKNAAWRLKEDANQVARQRTDLDVVRDKLGLRRTPTRAECIDISTIQGTATVASAVCFMEGRPAKDLYRHYRLETLHGAQDDFGAIREVVTRRLERARRDGDGPDLLVIDGGRGQLTAARTAAAAFPDLEFDLISLAKSRLHKDRARRRRSGRLPTEDLGEGRERSYERVFFPDRDAPQPLAPGTPEYRLLTSLRDEAHRFAITHHRRTRSRLMQDSELLSVPGIGPKLKARLMVAFGGLQGLKRATLTELRAIPGMKEGTAVALHSLLQTQVDAEAVDAGADSEPK